MEFEWDERKRRANLQRHGIDFTDVVEVFEGPTLVRMDTRFTYGEDRWIAVGISHGRVLVVAYTERNEGQTIRIISARRALSHERETFEKAIFRD
jgi:uncharacterized protein